MKVKEKTCERCGLANADNESESANPKIPPCVFCKRNKSKGEVVKLADFYTETWLLDENNEPMIEDPDLDERGLLNIMHDLNIVYGR